MGQMLKMEYTCTVLFMLTILTTFTGGNLSWSTTARSIPAKGIDSRSRLPRSHGSVAFAKSGFHAALKAGSELIPERPDAQPLHAKSNAWNGQKRSGKASN